MRRQDGFTLLEVLAALVVLGFIVAGLNAGLRFQLWAVAAQERVVDRTADLDAVARALRRLVGEADPGGSRTATLRGTANQMTFTTTAPLAMMAGAEQIDVALLTDSSHQLVLRWTPHGYGVPFGPPAPPQSAVLVRGVERIELAYWLAGWRATWTEPDLPKLVSVRVSFPPGDVRHWPDIVIATKLQRPP